MVFMGGSRIDWRNYQLKNISGGTLGDGCIVGSGGEFGVAGSFGTLSGKKEVETRSKDKKADNSCKSGGDKNGGGTQISRIPGVTEF